MPTIFNTFRADSIYEEMKQRYGTQGCYLLKINSRGSNRGADEQIPDPWSQYLQKSNIQVQVYFVSFLFNVMCFFFSLCFNNLLCSGTGDMKSLLHYCDLLLVVLKCMIEKAFLPKGFFLLERKNSPLDQTSIVFHRAPKHLRWRAIQMGHKGQYFLLDCYHKALFRYLLLL